MALEVGAVLRVDGVKHRGVLRVDGVKGGRGVVEPG
jgi:hypothetical protein